VFQGVFLYPDLSSTLEGQFEREVQDEIGQVEVFKMSKAIFKTVNNLTVSL